MEVSTMSLMNRFKKIAETGDLGTVNENVPYYKTGIDIFDYVSNNILMPIVSICTCILFGWIVKPRLLIGEMRLNGYAFRRKTLYIIMLRYIAPFLLAILLLGAFGLY